MGYGSESGVKTDNPADVGRHAFEVAGLGLAPFRFVGATENAITYPDGTTKAGGTCDYCGTGIRLECHVQSADGKRFKVGCNCIDKVGDKGLLAAYKSSPEFRQHQRELRYAKSAAQREAALALLNANREALSAKPHPHGFINRETGDPLTFVDYAEWMLDHAGANACAGLLKFIPKVLSGQ